MAVIKIRGRQEPIVIDNVRAKRIKLAKFGSPDRTKLPEPPDSLIDLGEWAGEIRQIIYIELDRAYSFGETEDAITDEDIKTLRAELKTLKPYVAKKREHGGVATKVWPKEQVMAQRGLIKVDEYGDMVYTRNLAGISKFERTWEAMKDKDRKREYAEGKSLEETFG